MQQPPTFATNRRVGCVMWLAIVALSLSIVGLFLDITQEMAWNQRVEQAATLLASNQPAVIPNQPAESAPTNTPVPALVTEGASGDSATPTISPTNTPVPPTNTPFPTVTPLPQATWTSVAPGMNTDLIVDGIRWRAVGVEEVGSTLISQNQFAEDVTTTGKFVRVIMEVESRKSEPIFYESPELMDSQGRRYNPFGETPLYISDDTDCHFEQFNPGVTRRCSDFFEVAADAGGYKLVVNNFEWPDAEEAIIELR